MSELSVTKITNIVDIQGVYFASVNAAYAAANSAVATANASSPVAAFNQANTVNATAIAAFAKANSALANTTGTFSGNLGFGLFPGCKIDTAGVIRTTSVGAPASGAGLELSYGGTANTADILAYDRTASVFRNIEMRANNIIFNLGGAGEKARLTSGGGYSVGTTADPGAGAIYATGNITAYYSDKRLKENITPIENALAKVNAISGVTYNGNDLAAEYGYTDRSQQVGVLAQEVQEVLPEAVRHAPFDIATNVDGVEYSRSGETYLTVQYEKLVPLLIEAIKELTKRVEELESK